MAAIDIDGAAAAETAALVESASRRALSLAVDVTDRDAVGRAIAETVESFGRLDALVNNAGALVMAPALEATPDDWGRQFEVNVQALFACCQLAARQMIRQEAGGAIVNVASNAGKVGYPNMAAYNASKAAVINLTRSLAAEWAEYGINVNAVCPGGVDTAMLAGVAEWVGGRTGEDPKEVLAAMTPRQLGRHVRPLEVGRVVVFLLSEHAAIIRGQSINVDGGEVPY